MGGGLVLGTAQLIGECALESYGYDCAGRIDMVFVLRMFDRG
jgi:hypothetical protein